MLMSIRSESSRVKLLFAVVVDVLQIIIIIIIIVVHFLGRTYFLITYLVCIKFLGITSKFASWLCFKLLTCKLHSYMRNLYIFFRIFHRFKFHLPGSNGLLVIAIKPKAKYRFRAIAKLVFNVLQNHFLPEKFHIFRSFVTIRSLIGSDVSSASHVFASVMLLLLL
jgi:hypothetical protein